MLSTEQLPLPKADIPPHSGRPLPFPNTYRDARNRICELQAGAGYGMFRYYASKELRAEVYALEMQVVSASENLEIRGKDLSSEHREVMCRIYELMKVPEVNGRK